MCVYVFAKERRQKERARQKERQRDKGLPFLGQLLNSGKFIFTL